MSGPDWVKLWHGDLFGDPWYRVLPAQEQGFYLQLLVIQANFEGYLPEGVDALARLTGYTVEEATPLWERVREKFPEAERGLANPKMLREVQEAEARSKAASARANARWKPDAKAKRRRKPKQ